MSLSAAASFSDDLVFVDESGDHGMASVNRDFPLFALAFCVFPKVAYVDAVTPALRRLKVTTFGHDLVVLHEHDIRNKEGAFAMMSRQPREAFLEAAAGPYEIDEFAYEQIDPEVYGNTAVLVSRYRQVARFDGRDLSHRMHVTDIWTRRDARWQIVRRHATVADE